jgi:hypothetical protein
MKLHLGKILLFAVLLSLGSNLNSGAGVIALGQATRPAATNPPRSDYVLRISTKDLITISLKAEKIPLTTVAADISKKLKVPVILGKSAGKREVNTDYKGLTLEPALQLLAPQVYIDYEVNHAPGAPPQPVGIYLNDEGDSSPSIGAVVPTNSQAILIEGHTEEGTESFEATKKEQPLQVTYERSALTVKAKQQLLSVVLYKIASELNIPFDIKSDSGEVVDVDINKASLEDAVQRMSPHVRLYVRADLRRLERRPFLMVLVAPKGS